MTLLTLIERKNGGLEVSSDARVAIGSPQVFSEMIASFIVSENKCRKGLDAHLLQIY